MKVYVAIVPLSYEIVAVATTEKGAIQAACKKALAFLRQNKATTSDTNTAAKIADYWGVFATEVTLDGPGALIGC